MRSLLILLGVSDVLPGKLVSLAFVVKVVARIVVKAIVRLFVVLL